MCGQVIKQINEALFREDSIASLFDESFPERRSASLETTAVGKILSFGPEALQNLFATAMSQALAAQNSANPQVAGWQGEKPGLVDGKTDRRLEVEIAVDRTFAKPDLKTVRPRLDVMTFNKWFAAGFKVRTGANVINVSLDGSTGLKSMCLVRDRSRKAWPRSNWRNSDGAYSRYSQSSPPPLRSNLPWIDLNRSRTAAIRFMTAMTSAFSAA
jgi:hypothetical protein